MVALCRGAAHIYEAKRWVITTTTLAIRFQHGLKPSERVILAHAAYFIELEAARLTWCDRDGPSDGDLAWFDLLTSLIRPAEARARGEDIETVRPKIRERSVDVPDAGVRTSELLIHLIRVATVVVENDAM